MTLADRPAPSILPFILFSFLLHALVVAVVPMLRGFPGPSDIPRVIELVALPQRAAAPQTGRVVDVPPPPVPQENPDAKLLAKQGSRVERETVNLGTPGAPSPPAAQARPQATAEQARFQAEVEQIQSEINALRNKQLAQRLQEKLRDREITRLRTRVAAEARRGNGGVNEPLDDVMRGPATRLNTRAFEESQYFLDFKTSFGVVFQPSNVTLGLSFPESLPSRPRTILSLEVNADGSLHDARVVRTSGYSALDRDALEAARRVFPFDPPPRKLLTSRHTLQFGFEVIY